MPGTACPQEIRGSGCEAHGNRWRLSRSHHLTSRALGPVTQHINNITRMLPAAIVRPGRWGVATASAPIRHLGSARCRPALMCPCRGRLLDDPETAILFSPARSFVFCAVPGGEEGPLHFIPASCRRQQADLANLPLGTHLRRWWQRLVLVTRDG